MRMKVVLVRNQSGGHANVRNALSKIKFQHHSTRLPDSIFLDAAVALGCRSFRERGWLTEVSSLAGLPEALGMEQLFHEKYQHSEAIILKTEEELARVGLFHGRANVEVLSSGSDASALLERFRDLLP